MVSEREFSGSLFHGLQDLSTTVNVPANSEVFISTDGGIGTTSNSSTGFSIVDVIIGVDDQVAQFRRVIAANTTGLTNMIAYWSFAVSRTLTAGQHTIEVAAKSGGFSSDATVSGDGSSVLQGQLTVMIINK